jgi:acetoacetyl-CoA synthetase
MTTDDDLPPIWQPTAERSAAARITAFQGWLAREKGLCFVDYQALWRWSVDDLDAFWTALVEHFALPLEGERAPVLAERSMPGARWFPNARTNYVNQVFRQRSSDRPALVFRNEAGARDEVSWERLERETASLAL